MSRPAPAAATGVAARLASFVLERFPFALRVVQEALGSCGGSRIVEGDAAHVEFFRLEFKRELRRALEDAAAGDLPDPTPGVTARQRLEAARSELIAACDAFLVREALAASLTADERREILRGMVLTRAVDNRLKQFFVSGEVKYGDAPFQVRGSVPWDRRRSMPRRSGCGAGRSTATLTKAGRETSSDRSSATSGRRWRCGPIARRFGWC